MTIHTMPSIGKSFQTEVFIMIAMCNPTAAEEKIAPHPSTESINLTELVNGTDHALLESMAPLVRRQCVALDLASVQRIDAAGVGALIKLYAAACEAGHCFTISNPSHRVAEILALVGVDRILMSANAIHALHTQTCLDRPAA
jgi:anti-anti-sigma regulatory factor